MTDKAIHVVLSGRVQGVAFRSFIEREAEAQQLSGWVRNRRDGTLEALFSGEADAIEEMLAACRRGPPGSRIDDVEITDADVIGGSFEVLPTE